jgi:hypothetical protein
VGFLVERESTYGKFGACSEGRELCGYLSDRPKNAKQRKALIATVCQACKGAMRLRIPNEKGRRTSLECTKQGCRAVRWINEEGDLGD